MAIANYFFFSPQIMMEKQLRGQPFSDKVLREMAIKLPESKIPVIRCKITTLTFAGITQMVDLEDVEQDKVQRYGSRFLKLTQTSKAFLLDMQRNQETNNEVVHDPNHTNVIDISSDEYGFSSDDDEIFASLSQMPNNEDSITSRYFDSAPNSRSSKGGRSARPSGTQCMAFLVTPSKLLTDKFLVTDLDGPAASRRGASRSTSGRGSRATGKRAGSGAGGGRKKAAGPSKRNFSGGSQRAKRTSKGNSSGGASSRRGGKSSASQSSSSRIAMMPT